MRAERRWTTGQCWLCDIPNVPVQWIGPARIHTPTDLIDADLYACGDCITRIHGRALKERHPRGLAELPT